MKIGLLSAYGDPNPTDFIVDSVICAGPTPTHTAVVAKRIRRAFNRLGQEHFLCGSFEGN